MSKSPRPIWRSVQVGLCLLALAVFLIWPAGAEVSGPAGEPPVCACCSDEGEWYEMRQPLDSSQRAELERMRFSATANTYQSAADDGELASTFALTQKRNGLRWELRFRDEQGKTGTLSFTLPATMISYGTDLHDSPPGGTGPSLYKEWRFTGPAQVTGIFKKGTMRAPQYRLILQGRGNRCPMMEDFQHWTLQLTSGRVSYSFYGSLSKPS
ncbi:MAG TPA: hypothetical protein VF735_07890 [Pyrinomonadaceae bacterium]|jgi:hypothetical protein